MTKKKPEYWPHFWFNSKRQNTSPLLCCNNIVSSHLVCSFQVFL